MQGESGLKSWLIRNLNTPIGTYKHALVRAGDMESLSVSMDESNMSNLLSATHPISRGN